MPIRRFGVLAAISAEDRALAALANDPIPLLIAGAVALDRTWSRVVAVVLSTLCLIGHLISWWIPYFGSATAAQRADFQEYYSRTLRFLPTEGHDVVIDVQHTVVALLTVAMLAATVIFAVRSWPRRRAVVGHRALATPAG